ncbi:LAME_0A05886g1_1 [Lachancea meyersii CBS 8951]|uniref:LAME_0A05886g1_1 n=1 Tax=Lachancea meyersii CBS 8951 TaxID=1266667 RepID=A0A1G4IPY6_9SACH|nr:LAME_0A05886g1_1 [Lachancea meyersii CBS 8951]
MSDIIIVGGGVFGLSTAAHFARSHTVTVIDKFTIPSPLSASTDYNKIVRLEYNDEVYANMAVEAMEYWQGKGNTVLPPGLLQDSYSHCGRISVVPPKSSPRYGFEIESLKLLRERFGRCDAVAEFSDDLTCGGMFPEFKSSHGQGTFRFNPDCGIGLAAKSLLTLKRHCESLGVSFLENDGVACIDGGDERVKITLASGKELFAQRALVACGANTSTVVNLNGSVKSTGLYVGHIQLSVEEFEKYKNIPVVFDPTMGYFFPPDRETRLLKLCASASSTYDKASGGLLPRYQHLEPDTVKSIPVQSVAQIRTLIHEYLPELEFDSQGQLREVKDCKICWISDTSNSDFIIDEVPSKPNVFVSCGDSGHGYKFLPNIGSYIKARMDRNLSPQLASKWALRESHWTTQTIPWRVEHKRKHIDEIEWH